MAFIEKKKKRRGDQRFGHLVRDLPVINKITVNLYPNRCDNEVSSTIDFDITNLMNYIKARKEKDPNSQIKFFPCIIAALTRVLNDRRLLLRYVSNHHVYEKDEIRISFIAKRAFRDNAEETLVHYIPKKDDNIDSVVDCVVGKVKESKNEHEEVEKGSVEAFTRLPYWVLRFIIFLLRRLDKHGRAPKSATEDDPSFSTVLLSNLGSIGYKSVYHHLNNYGNCSIMCTIGLIHEKKVKNANGQEETRTFVDITSIFDERIADGFYFIKSMQLMQEYLNHPETLEKPFDEEVKF